MDDDSFPPIPPIAGGAAGSRDLYLTSADGTRVMAHAARAAKPTGAGMVVIPDVRGLPRYYKELADRFAEAVEQVRLIRSLGFDSLWGGEHHATPGFHYFPLLPLLQRLA
ncbi:MAG TPA: hypothetical protein VLK28_14105, partial [Methylomirabilota bacterium]|nr:hypothetical protein [Methylomirabilota bacterium]